MKPSLFQLRRVAFAMIGLMTGKMASAQNANAVLAITNNASGASIRVTDLNNRTWSVQASSDFVNWSEVEKVRVHNGSFTAAAKTLLPANVFFRALAAESAERTI